MAGRLVYFELPAADPSRSTEFYKSLFGWSFNKMEGPMEYYMTEAGGQPGGGLYPAQGGDDRTAKIYFDTDDIEASLAQVRELGGTAGEKSPVPGMGWYAECQDPGGTKFSLWQSDQSAGG